MGGESKNWSLEFGLYPGILFGFRSYEDEEKSIHVLYIPFVDLALFIYN
jgi:hypothetical protein|tara:strand:+ start:356 stop:502 length:147 start_codon:yes stop_codon:yes gene_type:complete